MNQEKLLHQLKTIAWLNINLSKLEPKISKAYNDLAEAYMDGVNVEMIKANADTYRYLLSYSVLFPVCAMAQSGALECSDVTGEYGSAGMLLTDDGDYNIFRIRDELISLIGKQPIEDIPDGMQVKLALDTIGLKVINKSDLEDAEDVDDGDVGLSSEEIERMLNGENSSEDDGKVSESEENSANKIDLEKTDNADAEAEKAAVNDAKESDKAKTLEEKYKNWDEIFTGEVSNLLERFEELYSSGYSGVIKSQEGILSNIGIIKAFSDRKVIGLKDGNDFLGPLMFSTIQKAIKESIIGNTEFESFRGVSEGRVSTISNKGENKTYDELNDEYYIDLNLLNYGINREIVYGMHSRLCFGYYASCPGLKDFVINKCGITKEQIGKTTGVKDFNIMKKYISHEIKKICYNVYEKEGIPTSWVDSKIAPDELLKKVNYINSRVFDVFKNAITVVKRIKVKSGSVWTIKISTNFEYNGDKLVASIQNRLKCGVELIDSTNGVNTIKIYYGIQNKDLDDAKSDKLFTRDVLDGLIESGKVPSWKNALLGNLQTDKPFMWDKFAKDGDNSPSNRVYAIYAESRSGKGNITSSLLCNAIASNCKVLYIDGKPETGAGFGRLAWLNNLEAPVFNGHTEASQQYGNVSLEDLTNGIRTNEMALTSFDKIPEGLFKSNDIKKTFIRLCTFFRGLHLTMKLINFRNKQVGKSSDDIMIFIFDELQRTAGDEAFIKEQFSTYLSDHYNKSIEISSNKGRSTLEFKGKGVNKSEIFEKDQCVKFIYSWLKWVSSCDQDMQSAITISIGGANCNIFFIFQGSTWFGEPGIKDTYIVNGIISRILNCKKIIGFGGISGNAVPGFTAFGSKLAIDYNWSQYLKNHKGTWALVKNGNVDSSESDDSVVLFKPFELYLEPYKGSEDERIAERIKNGQSTDIEADAFEMQKFIGGYTYKLMNGLGIQKTAGQILNESYIYIDNAIKQSGIGKDILSYMYDAHSFVDDNSSIMNDEQQESSSLERYIVNSDGQNHVTSNIGLDQADFDPEDGEVIGGETPQEDGAQNNEEVNPLYNDPRYRRLYQQMQSEMPNQPNQPIYGEQDQGNYQGQDWQDQENYSDQAEQGQDWQGQDEQFDYPEQGMQGSDYSNAGQWQGYPNDAQTDQYRDPRNPFNASDMPGYNNINSGDGIFSGATGQQVSAKFDEGVYNPNSAYQITNGITFISPISKTQKMGLNERNSVILDVHEDKSLKMHRGGIFRTLRGTEYELKHRWDTILNAVADKQSTVTRVVICNDLLLFNNRQIACYGILGGEEGIEVRDIVNMGRLNKVFPTIKELTIDQEIGMAISSEIGSDITGGLFGLFRNLQILHLLEGSNNFTLTRQSLNDSQSRRDAEKRANKIRLAHAIDGVAALNSTKDRATQGVGVHRLSNVYNNLQGGLAEKFQSNIMKGTTGGLVLGSLAVTGAIVLGVPRAIFGSFRKLIRRR